MPSPTSHPTPPPDASTRRVPYAVAARELLRNTLLDAACEQLQSRRWAEVKMADIALSAGVSRQTLYNEFGSREEFTQALVMREAERFLSAVQQAVNSHLDDPARAIAAAFDVFLSAAGENPLVRTVVSGTGAEELLALATTQGKPLVESATEHLSDIILAGWPPMARADVEILSECLVRLAISYAALPKGPTSMSAASVATLLGPYVERLVEQASAASAAA